MAWDSSQLWKHIEGRNNEASRRTLEACLPEIETILRSGGTSPIDFTLHDDQHSFRVAERMFSLMRAQADLFSTNELSLLLLSAYLHDIGMSPSRDKVQRHFRYLFTGGDNLLNPIERADLQKWLDQNWGALTPPITATNKLTGLSLCEEACAYYCRARHNDWSEEWIEENLRSISPGLYAGWVDDLITLCRSHHEDYYALLDPRFDARLVGAPATSLNLRYLAAILRVADVVEFDPERTPPIILEHRKIAPASRIFWHRDQGISFEIAADKPELIFSARTPDAYIHKAVLTVAEYVNVELGCCHHLQQQGAFLRGFIPDDARQRYIWPLPSQLSLDVKEKDDHFTYIDGTFRPDVPKLLNLLSGTQLYHNPLAAIRELVQNAADAIAEQIGYERLEQDDPENATHEATFAGLHKVRMTFEFDGERHWLRCVDDGVGLIKHLIETRLLVSGSNARPEYQALQREAQSKGFTVFRTGQFGIGLLSYFMVADRIEFETKRSPNARDSEGLAWKFATEGVSSFGELTKSNRDRSGTDVRLRIRQDLFQEGPEAWFDHLQSYLRQTLRHLPCRFELRSNLSSPAIRWSAGPGWTAQMSDFTDRVITRLGSPSVRSTIMSTFEEEEAKQRDELQWVAIRTTATEKLRWFGPIEHKSEKFKARVWIPYFELHDGASLAFITLDGNQLVRAPDGSDVCLSRGLTVFSWKGFRLSAMRSRERRIAIIEVDVLAGQNLAINRSSLTLENSADLHRQINELERAAINSFLDVHKTSSYRFLNDQLSSPKTPVAVVGKRFAWKTPTENNSAQWSELSFPLSEVPRATYDHSWPKWRNVLHNGTAVPILTRVEVSKHQYAEAAREIGGGRLTILPQRGGWIPCTLWLDIPDAKFSMWSSKFPPTWQKLLLVRTPSRQFWNEEHPLVKLLDHASLPEQEGDLKERLVASLSSKANAARFVVSELRDARHFRAMQHNYSEEFSKLSDLLEIETAPVYWWNFDSLYGPNNRTSMISSNKIDDRSSPFDTSKNLTFADGSELELPEPDWLIHPPAPE